jgi:hypothetical protein
MHSLFIPCNRPKPFRDSKGWWLYLITQTSVGMPWMLWIMQMLWIAWMLQMVLEARYTQPLVYQLFFVGSCQLQPQQPTIRPQPRSKGSAAVCSKAKEPLFLLSVPHNSQVCNIGPYIHFTKVPTISQQVDLVQPKKSIILASGAQNASQMSDTDASQLRRALQAQKAPTRKSIRGICK